VNPYTRGPALLAQTAAAMSDVSGGRFGLGLGVSSKTIVEDFNGMTMDRPLATMRESVLYLRSALAGGRVQGGFRLNPPPERPVPIILAALRRKMLRLAAEVGDGAFANFLPRSGARQVAAAFGAADKELACRVFSFVGPEDEALAAASRPFAAYGSVPAYAAFFRWLGWGERLDPMVEAWTAGDRRRALELVPHDLVQEIFLTGPLEAQRERLVELMDGGITTAVLAFYGPADRLTAAIQAMAPR